MMHGATALPAVDAPNQNHKKVLRTTIFHMSKSKMKISFNYTRSKTGKCLGSPTFFSWKKFGRGNSLVDKPKISKASATKIRWEGEWDEKLVLFFFFWFLFSSICHLSPLMEWAQAQLGILPLTCVPAFTMACA